MKQELPQGRRPPAGFVHQNIDRREQFVGVGDVVDREFAELFGFKRIQHPHVAHRQGDRRLRRAVEQAGRLPARPRVVFGDRTAQPHERAGDQKRVQARRVARAFVEQVLQAAANLDGEQIDIHIARCAAETEPEPVRKGAHPRRAGDFQGRCVVFLCRAGPCLEPGSLPLDIGLLKARRGLRPSPDSFAHKNVHRLKIHHFRSILCEFET
ncbi:MAG TPA: hypothetical protein VF286_14470 [Acidiphilium sp.]